MILSYRDQKPGGFAGGEIGKALQGFEDQAAPSLDTLRGLPSNRFEAMRGDRAGQYSIHINQLWRICFEWPDGQPGSGNGEIGDYN